MFYNVKQRLARTRFSLACRAIHSTPPLRLRDGPLHILTLLAHGDITMYLLAIKSLYPRLGEGRVTVLNDGSLNASDQALLQRQVEGIQFIPIQSIETGNCPKGGCWERLIYALELSRTSYVIQMDSDTLTRGGMEEVLDAYRDNRSFTLGTPRGQKVVSLEESFDIVKDSASQHVSSTTVL